MVDIVDIVYYAGVNMVIMCVMVGGVGEGKRVVVNVEVEVRVRRLGH